MSVSLALGTVVRDDMDGLRHVIDGPAKAFDEVIVVVDRPDSRALRAVANVTSSCSCTIVVSTEASQDLGRNLYLDHSGSDWLLALDSDEAISPQAVCALRSELERVPSALAALRLPILNYFGHGRWFTSFTPRVIRIGSPVRYDGSAWHTTLTAGPQEIGRCAQFIEHFGPLRSRSELAKRQRRAADMEARVDRASSSTFLCMLALEYLALGEVSGALGRLQAALATEPDSARDFPRFLRALLDYRLGLPWLAEQELEAVASQKAFCAEAQLLLADLDVRRGRLDSALARVLPYLDMHPSSPHLLVNAASIACVIQPQAALDYARTALSVLPTLRAPEIYSEGAPYNPYSIQDIFLACYDTIFGAMHRACLHLGQLSEAKEWMEEHRRVLGLT